MWLHPVSVRKNAQTYISSELCLTPEIKSKYFRTGECVGIGQTTVRLKSPRSPNSRLPKLEDLEFGLFNRIFDLNTSFCVHIQPTHNILNTDISKYSLKSKNTGLDAFGLNLVTCICIV